jgi:hypothetical protein
LPNEEKKTQTQTRSTPQKTEVKDKQDKKSSETVQKSHEENKTQTQTKSTLQKPEVKQDKKSSETVQGSQKNPTPQGSKIASADGDTKGSAPSGSKAHQGPLVIKLDELISCWKQLANAKGRTAINEGLQRMKQVDPQMSFIEHNSDEQIISAAEQSVEKFEALADLADKALAGKSFDTIIKNDKTGFLLRYLASRAIALQGKSKDEFDAIYDNFEANPDQPIVKKIAEELKQKGFVSDYYGEKPKTFAQNRSTRN